MTNTTNQTKSKRLSPSWRKHVRRLKQAARKTGTAYTSRPCINTSTTQTALIVSWGTLIALAILVTIASDRAPFRQSRVPLSLALQ